MDNVFEVGSTSGEVWILFDHLDAENYMGASVFWVRRMAALGGEKEAIAHWQMKRDGERRGIVEVINHDSE